MEGLHDDIAQDFVRPGMQLEDVNLEIHVGLQAQRKLSAALEAENVGEGRILHIGHRFFHLYNHIPAKRQGVLVIFFIILANEPISIISPGIEGSNGETGAGAAETVHFHLEFRDDVIPVLLAGNKQAQGQCEKSKSFHHRSL